MARCPLGTALRAQHELDKSSGHRRRRDPWRLAALGPRPLAQSAVAVDAAGPVSYTHLVLQLGTPKLLSAAEMTRVLAKFANYGQQDGPPD